MVASTSDGGFRGCLSTSEALAVLGAANFDFLSVCAFIFRTSARERRDPPEYLFRKGSQFIKESRTNPTKSYTF